MGSDTAGMPGARRDEGSRSRAATCTLPIDARGAGPRRADGRARAVIGADAGADKSKGDGKRERAVDTAVDADGGAETDRGINVTTSARLAGRGASGAAAVPAGSAQRSIASHASP
ncbi:hypothetical protein V4E86_16440 [Burkholderia pseudomallei]|uniref:hypothetical protein n=3 Tax=Burkholderia pseudomallei TaxID=28450 RepID=UPI001CC2C00A|nr:hypothetical protein [Burkholderia pseudomallei]MCL4667470.1 hypothetical protein [Burkholderia pseudomallei]MCQ8218295.1 hypothetical protein [Burkholderia pseudomallei]MCV9913873.1 hypothetical protein [Burkholderia pseudomallei]MCV9972305.1 hypothetical protein [Burkholderia pseudomallei]MCW0070579.1 hypothetical protein [Burkholderia pseudomallei]